MYKVSKSMYPPQITELFERRNKHLHNLRHNAEFLQPFVNFIPCGSLKTGSLKTVHVEFVRLLSKI